VGRTTLTKSGESKAAVQSHSNSATDKVVKLLQQRASSLSLSESIVEANDPQESMVRGVAVTVQVEAAEKDGTPMLLCWDGDAGAPVKAVFKLLLELATAEINKPGGRAPRAETPKVSPMVLASNNAEQVRRRAKVAAEGSPLEAAKNATTAQQIFGDRPTPSSKVAWIAELSSMSKAIEQLAAIPPALAAMLPLIHDALAQVQAAQPLPAGRFSSPFVYSEEAIRAALAVELALGDFRAWAAASANETRYAAILKATSPKRQSDTKPADPAKPADGTQPAAPMDSAQQAAASTVAAHANGAETAGKPATA
jgi:hypothetical protein